MSTDQIKVATPFQYPISRLVYRPLSVPLATLAARTPITPSQLTLVAAALALAGAGAFALGAYVVGALLTIVAAITDCADGDLARMTGRTSKMGAFLDSVLDRWTDGALILGLWVSNTNDFGIVAGFALIGSFLTSYTRARAQSLGADCPEGIGGRDARILVLVIAALFGFVWWGLAIVALIGSATAIQRAVIAYRLLGVQDRL
jgi:phosphatidylglycerophosphate synthase